MSKENIREESASKRKSLSTPLVEEVAAEPYITTDINVVAYLMMQKYSVHSIAREEGSNRAAFCFMLPSPEEKDELRKHVRDYHNNVGNFRLYSDCWRNAKGSIHNMR